MSHRLNVKCESVNSGKDTWEKSSMTLGQAKVSLTETQKHKQQNKRHNLALNKIENFCYMKDIIQRVKRQTTDWEKMFTNHVSDKGHYSEYIHV